MPLIFKTGHPAFAFIYRFAGPVPHTYNTNLIPLCMTLSGHVYDASLALGPCIRAFTLRGLPSTALNSLSC